MRIGAVVLAAGFGSFRDGFPKVLEEIDGVPLVCRAISAVRSAQLAPIVVVLNTSRFAHRAQETVAREFPECRFAVQQRRSGAADAVLAALPHCTEDGVGHVLVTYADMPLWSADTVRRLATTHRECDTVMSMVTLQLDGNHPPELERYGRVIRDEAGRIVRIVEPADATQEERAVRSVNPSLYIFDVQWFAEHAPCVTPKDRGDGREPERYIPPLAAVAHAQHRYIAELPLLDPYEALGVNTPDELVRVRTASAQTTSMTARLP